LQLAAEIGLDVKQFENDLESKLVQDEFAAQLQFCDDINVHSYPTLMLEVDGSFYPVLQDYLSAEKSLKSIRETLQGLV
jgi:putative protein-disulfide isomerase